MFKITLFFILTILLSNCKSESVEQIPTTAKIQFTGITRTDAIGVTIENDPTDWGFNDIWQTKESDLFDATLQKTCTSVNTNKIIAYPNPCKDIFVLNMNRNDSTFIDIQLVDKNFKKLTTLKSLKSRAIMFNTADFGKGTIRLYYKFISNNCEFIGHGDILIE